MHSPTDKEHSPETGYVPGVGIPVSLRIVTSLRDRLAARERWIWGLVLLVLVADFGLTIFGFSLGLDESNPLALWLLARFGLAGILGLKLGVLGMAILFRYLMPDEYGVIVPVALVVPWTYAVLVNVFVIARTI